MDIIIKRMDSRTTGNKQYIYRCLTGFINPLYRNRYVIEITTKIDGCVKAVDTMDYLRKDVDLNQPLYDQFMV